IALCQFITDSVIPTMPVPSDQQRHSTPPNLNNLPRRVPITLHSYVRALQRISDPVEHADAVFNGRFVWNKVTPVTVPQKLVSVEQRNEYYIGIDADSVIITTEHLTFLRGTAKLQFAHSFDGAITHNTHVKCWAPEDMDPEPAYKMINTLFADLGQDSCLNIVFPHLRPADDPYPRRNFLNGTEMKYFYEELVYVAARKVLHDTIDQQ
ncbi:hypothetical protein GGH97_004746, partial [Coemansia sp. RSA 475]